MIDPADIHPLTEFQRNTKEALRRLKKSRRPEVLTVNGRAALVVLDPRAYRALVELALGISETAALREGIRDMRAGRVRPARDVLDDLDAKYLSARRKPRKSA